MHRGIFKRIFILYGSILLLAIVGTEYFVTDAVRNSRVNSLRDSLAVQAELIGRQVPFTGPARLDRLCRRFREDVGARVTVIAPDGRVLGDSDHDSATMDNHRDRLEVRQADLAGIGMTIRHSDTLDENLLYVARKISRQDAPVGFLRLSVPLGSVETAVNRLRVRIVLAVAAILLAASMFPLWQIERIRRLTVQIRDFAAAVARGEPGRRLFLGHAGEFEEIADSLNTMSTELKHSIALTEEERNRLSVILSSIPDALLISDPQGVIQLSSTASRDFFGDRPLAGRQFIEIIRDRQFLAVLEQTRTGRLPETAEVVIDHPQERHCIVRISPLFYRGRELSGLVAVFHDITQLRKLEQVRKDFVANVSHEIRTPITAILGYTETLLDGALEDRDNSRTFLETIRENSRRINSLVNDLMTISQIELGAISVILSDVDFGDAAEAVLAVLGPKAAAKGIELTKSVPPEFRLIRADRDRLVQILTNLADNAIKFTDNGKVTLGIGRENGKTCFFVTDTGVGVPEKHLSRLGERFYRVDAARSRSLGGTGLGLAIVKHLVKAHGWDIQIESKEGRGTVIRICL